MSNSWVKKYNEKIKHTSLTFRNNKRCIFTNDFKAPGNMQYK